MTKLTTTAVVAVVIIMGVAAIVVVGHAAKAQADAEKPRTIEAVGPAAAAFGPGWGDLLRRSRLAGIDAITRAQWSKTPI